MWKQPIKTNLFLWLIASLILFVIFGFVNWIPEGKTECYWLWWVILLEGKYGCSNFDFVFALCFGAIFHAIPAIILGWALQAIIQSIHAMRKRIGRQKIDK